MGCGSSAPAEGNEFDNLFKDPEFPAAPSSLYYNKEKQETAKEVVWKRPRDLSNKAHLLVDGVCGCDVAQGGLGDCWFLAGCAAIAKNPDLLKNVIREEVDLTGQDYNGKLTFYFWRWGKWKAVTIDDRLPTSDGTSLLFSKCDDASEFWLPLLEKAYAKLHGTFEALEGGQEMDAMVDLTGGLAEYYLIGNDTTINEEEEKQIFKQLYRAFANGAFTTCGRVGRMQFESGLVSGHAYTMTNVAYVSAEGAEEPIRMVKIKNPWASDFEWTGAWSDKDEANWNRVSYATKERIGFQVAGDGQFWMTFADFWNEFYDLTICNLSPDLDLDGRNDDPLSTLVHVYGKWSGKSAAGTTSDGERPSAANPQYLLNVSAPDDGDEDGECSVVVGLMQMYRRKNITAMPNFLPLAFCIYPASSDDPESLLSDADMSRTELHRSDKWLEQDLREVIKRVELKPGNYVLVPTTKEKGADAEFMIRLYAGKPVTIKALT